MTQGYKMMINNNKEEDKKVVICHKLASDRGALFMMCGRDEKPQPSATACWKISMAYAHYRAMDTSCQ